MSKACKTSRIDSSALTEKDEKKYGQLMQKQMCGDAYESLAELKFMRHTLSIFGYFKSPKQICHPRAQSAFWM